MKIKFTLFLPMYNVKATVVDVLERIPQEALAQLQEVLLVDNGSTDGTVEEVSRYLSARQDPRFRLFVNEQNYYLGGSTIIALSKAMENGSQFLICLHSDGQADPKEILTFIEKCEIGLDFVFGSRLSGEQKEYSLLRTLGNKFFAGLQRFITKQPINDIGAYVAFNLNSLREIPYWRIPHDMAYQPLLVLYLCLQRPIRFKEFPIQWGKVETSNVNPFSYGLLHLARLVLMASGFFPLNSLSREHFRSREVTTRAVN